VSALKVGHRESQCLGNPPFVEDRFKVATTVCDWHKAQGERKNFQLLLPGQGPASLAARHAP
jgi:hypothetical protein